MNALGFDLETAPLPNVLESKFAPVAEEFQFQPFDPSKVKRLKSDDDETYRVKYIEQQGLHIQSQDEKKAKLIVDFKEKQEEFLDSCCLFPHLGRILVIGLHNGERFHVLEGDEDSVIAQFFSQYRACVKKQMQLVSHGGMNFDWPFIIRRAWVLGIKVPGDLVIPSGKYCNWNKLLIDTGQLWLLGQYPRDTRWSLDVVGHALGFGGKNVEGVEGKGFWRMYEKDRELALKYLENDCLQPLKIFARICPPTI